MDTAGKLRQQNGRGKRPEIGSECHESNGRVKHCSIRVLQSGPLRTINHTNRIGNRCRIFKAGEKFRGISEDNRQIRNSEHVICAIGLRSDQGLVV